MKAQVKVFVVMAAVVLSGVGFSAVAQINFNANDIQFRAPNNSSRTTIHYGDFVLHGGNASSQRGYLYAYSPIVAYSDTYISGSLYLSGNKHFIHPHPTNDSKLIKYIAIESGEALTLARGTARTVNGQATIELPEHFSLVTSKDAPITVILTPEGAPVLLYTKQKSREKVVVAMKPSDFSEFKDVEFSFQVTGVRDGFEKQEVIVDEDKLESSTNIRDDVQKRIDAYTERVKARHELKYQEKE